MPISGNWTDPNALDLITNQVLTQTIYENLLGNLLYQGGSNGQALALAFKASGTASNPTTTSLVHVVLPDMTVTFTALSNSFGFVFAETTINNGGSTYIAHRVNGGPFGGYGGERHVGGGANDQHLTYMSYIDGLTAGSSYTIDIGWRTTAGTATAVGTERSVYVFQWRH